MITNLINYKVYVGQTTKPKNRWSAHKCEAKAGRLHYPIHKAIRKYGFENFQFNIIDILFSQEAVNLSEEMWINILDTLESQMGYNLAVGGNSNSGWHHTESTKEKISSAQKGVPRQLHSEETKKKMSKSRMGIFCGENGPASKLSKEDVIQIKLMLSEGKSANSIAKMYNVSANAILHIKHGKTWK